MTTDPKRVLVSVDVNNMWHSCQEVWGPSYRVNYQALQQLIQQLENNDQTKFRWVAYVVSVPYRRPDHQTGEPRNQGFIESLEQMGYIVKVRHMQYEKEKPFNSDWDVGITVDALDWADEYNTFYLVSGDGDYVPLIQSLVRRGKRVEIVTIKQTTSFMLYNFSHRVTYLTSSQVFKK